MKQLFIQLVTFLYILNPSLASDCRCKADPFTKKYQLFEKKWWGTRRHWSCEYSCNDSIGQQSKIIGYHKNWFLTDNGKEGICDGLTYKETYSVFKNDFIWDLDQANEFDPAKSSSPDLKKWSKDNCN